MPDRVIALFAGAGGLSTGFAEAGWKPQTAADIDADACATYERNLGVEAHQIDLASSDAFFGSGFNNSGEVAAVIGGPPCQGFSTAGGRNGHDPRNRLIFTYLEIVTRLSPRWFLFENVEGLLTSNGGHSVAALVREFLKLGYWVRLEKINFASYGLPQARKRVVIVGNRIGVDFRFPSATHSFDAGKHRGGHTLPSAPTLTQALAGLGRAVRGKSGAVPYASENSASEYDAQMRVGNNSGIASHHSWVATDSDIARFRQLGQGQTMKDLPEDQWHESFRRRAFRRVSDGTPTEKRGGAPAGVKRLAAHLNALTITGSSTREFIHPTEDRPLTLREAARLQSFPDRFQFSGKRSSIAQQIGNAFPPLASLRLAQEIQRLDSQFGSGVAVSRATWKTPYLLGFRLTDASGMSPALAGTDMMLRKLAGDQLTLEMS